MKDIETTLLVEDALSMSVLRVDGLSRLCLGMIEAKTEDSGSWHVLYEELILTKKELLRAYDALRSSEFNIL